jgi:hypothetical protein
MSTFGKSNGGGRRKAPRDPMPLFAVVSTVDYERRVGVLNVCTRGVQLTSPDLPRDGEIVIFQLETVQALGQVVWSRPGQCGVAFKEPLLKEQVDQLRNEANLTADLPYLSLGQGYGEAA